MSVFPIWLNDEVKQERYRHLVILRGCLGEALAAIRSVNAPGAAAAAAVLLKTPTVQVQ